MKLKKAVRKIHLCIGLAAGAVIFVVAVTGTLLAFRDELEPLIYHKELFVNDVMAQRMHMDDLMQIARQKLPGDCITKITIFPVADRTVLFRMQADKPGSPRMLISMDPYSGQILKVRYYDRWFFEGVKQMHRYLLMGNFGKAVTGISCALLFIMLISGIVLWWPKTKRAIRQRFRIKVKSSAKRRNWDLHAVTGFYASPFLLIVVITGLAMSYSWFGDALSFVIDGGVSTSAVMQDRPSQKIFHETAVYEQMLDTTNKIFDFPGKITILPPFGKRAVASINKENDNATVKGTISTVSFDPTTAKIVAVKPFDKGSSGTKIRSLVTSIHTGIIFGWPTKLLALILALCVASFPITGFLIWRGKRKRKNVKFVGYRRKSSRAVPAEIVE